MSIGKNFNLSVPITHSLNTETKMSPEQDPIHEVMVASFDDLIKSNPSEHGHLFIKEEDKDFVEPEPLDELKEPPKPPIEFKPLSPGLKYAFLNNDLDSPVIISDKLS